ncbi:amino acid ABC transporter permease [Sinorhizobium fredii]|uniref:amino acid ABC transporter permease n=1 Tax=Rhizobium fredii TaxID=380 RepID=UPI003519B161
MDYAWNWGIFLEPAPDGSSTYLAMMLNGARTTLILAGSAWLLALLLGVPLGIARHVGGVAGFFARCYVEVFRNIPLLVQMFLWFFVMPEFLPTDLQREVKRSAASPLALAIVSLGFYTSARIAEQVRAGLGSIPRGQAMAGKALGLSGPQVFRYVLLPRVARLLMPILTSESISIVKNSAVALTIGVVELTAQARSMQEYSFQVFEAFIFATAGYLLVNLVIITFMTTIERAIAVPGLAGTPRTTARAGAA